VEPTFTNLLIVVAVGFSAPFLLGLAPKLRLPSIVLEIVAGIAVGPAGFGWVSVDETVNVLSTIGLGFLLFLAGLEIEFDRLRGRLLRLAAGGYVVSFALAIVVALGLRATGLIETPLLIAITLCATSLGVLIPVLKDSGQISSGFGQLVLAAGTIADFAAVILLSIFFSGQGGVGSTIFLIVSLVVLAVVVYLATISAEHSTRISMDLLRLQNTTAQIRVRGAMVLLIGFAAAAQTLGLEVILGTFMAGALLTLLDRDEMMRHPDFRPKLNAIGFGFFIPIFFVTTGVKYDLSALFSSTSTVITVPIFLAALVVIRGLPALLYRGYLPREQVPIIGLLQSTSLPFIVAATSIGVDLGLVDAGESAALIAAGLLSVLLFPLIGLTLLRRSGIARQEEAAAGAGPAEEPQMAM
jgi:Kef-type K+ transport system membrane component KefB